MNFSFIDKKVINISDEEVFKIYDKEILLKDLESINNILENSYKHVNNFNLMFYSGLGFLIWKFLSGGISFDNSSIIASVFVLLFIFFFFYEREKIKIIIARKREILNQLNKINNIYSNEYIIEDELLKKWVNY